jgi:hypothetical protein
MVHSPAMVGRGARRVLFVLTSGLLPIAATMWMGCGDDDPAPAVAALGKPDPGGTWGAQISVTVVGRGRVTAGSALDCPRGACAATIIFPGNAADGATGGLPLTA